MLNTMAKRFKPLLRCFCGNDIQTNIPINNVKINITAEPIPSTTAINKETKNAMNIFMRYYFLSFSMLTTTGGK